MLVDLTPGQVAILQSDRVLGTLHAWPEEADRQLLLRALAVATLDSPGFNYAHRLIAAQIRGGPGEDGTAMYDTFKQVMADRFKGDATE